MKKFLLSLFLGMAAFSADAQLAAGHYGPYQFVANYDHKGNLMDIRGFETINLQVMSTAFFGIMQSSCYYTYDYFGSFQTSGSFEYKGVSNGWYVYSFYGMQLLVSLDEDTIRTTNPYGGYSVYEK